MGKSSLTISFSRDSNWTKNKADSELRGSPAQLDNSLPKNLTSKSMKLALVAETQPAFGRVLYADDDSLVSETENRNGTLPVEAPHYV